MRLSWVLTSCTRVKNSVKNIIYVFPFYILKYNVIIALDKVCFDILKYEVLGIKHTQKS